MFGNFLRKIDPVLYQEYVLDVFKGKNSSYSDSYVSDKVYDGVRPLSDDRVALLKDNTKRISFPTSGIKLPTIASLGEYHFAKQYCVERKLPKEWLSRLYYASDFQSFINELKPDYFGVSQPFIAVDKRLIIPIIDENRKLVGISGRTLSTEKNKIKYITILLDDFSKKIFGLDRADVSKRVYALEGPLDSIFLDNAIATLDAAIYNAASVANTITYVGDNQPDNPDTKRVMRRIIDLGLDIFIWPPEWRDYKDINDLVKGGINPSEIPAVIDVRTYNGLRATLEMGQWEK